MSEPLPASSRCTIQDVFGVRVVDNYAMAECMALSNGCTVEELRETFKHVSTYAGVPAAVDAFRVAGEVLAAHAAA